MPDQTDATGARELIEILPTGRTRNRWSPVVGEETLALFDQLRLPQPSAERVRAEAVSILGKCIPPSGPDESHTGLVVGHIQSGKTMSFTAVAALARDNGFPLVIVITGVSKPLFEQSTTRLQRDLRLHSRPDRKWQHFPNPRPGGSDRSAMQGVLDDWRDPGVPSTERQTILITVMKNHRHLLALVRLLQQLDLRQLGAVIIDDEADQAGLNTRISQGEQSTTYRRLLSLRSVIPRHSYVQYTATPQAPLLISLIDMLSPRFGKVLTPGDDYVGGRDLFIDQPALVHPIPPDEIPTRVAPLDEPPPTLLVALQIFFLGVAAGYIRDSQRGNRSMLVHPSQEVLKHAKYYYWVNQVSGQWLATLSLPEADADRRDLIEEFAFAYQDLRATVPDLPPFTELCAILPRVVRKTYTIEVNASRGRTPEVPWSSAYAFILVGGQAMDRGFTVEGLTVTYMPRSMGVGNADTIQQRARFLGYKRPYLGYCRVFLAQEVAEAYRRYVTHEDDIRRQLVDLEASGKPLSEWRRAFFLDGALRPTRQEVLDLDYMRGDFSNEWFEQRAPHDSEQAVEHNRQLVNSFISRLKLAADEGHEKRTPIQQHRVAADIPLGEVYKELLAPLQVTRQPEFHRYLGLQLQVSAFLEKYPDALCTVYEMSCGRQRDRTLSKGDEIPELFQGANYQAKVKTYPGDREIRSLGQLTVQIHRLRLLKHDSQDVKAEHVPALAVWVPEVMSQAWLIQDPPTGGR